MPIKNLYSKSLSVAITVCTGIAPDDMKIYFSFSFKPDWQWNQVHQKVDMEVDLIATRYRFCDSQNVSGCPPPFTGKQMIDPAVPRMYTHETTRWQINNHYTLEGNVERVSHTHGRRIYIQRELILPPQQPYTHSPILIDKVWSWINNNFT